MEELYLFEKNGKRRKAIKTICQFCKKEFLIRERDLSRGRGKYCSVDCTNKDVKEEVKLNCAQCGKSFLKQECKMRYSRSGIHFCSRDCKDQAQRIGGIKEIMPPHYGSSCGREVYKTLIERSDNPVCAGCGASKKYLLQVHHIDGNKDNNIIDNLEIVCGNCHITRHLMKKGDGWVYWTKALTPRELLNELSA